MIVSGFGHTPETFGGWESEISYHQMVSFAASRVLINSETAFVTKAEVGWEMALAEAALHLGIPTMVLVPFSGYQADIPNFWNQKYTLILENSPVVKAISDLKPGSTYEAFNLMENTNDWIFDYTKEKNGKFYVLWNGEKDDSAYKVRRSERMGVEVINFWKEFNSGLNRSLF
jgi:hypothetical protein